MEVPSVLMCIEYNYLLNHTQTIYSKVKITNLCPLKIDERVLKATT